jgi:diguanylate cyclase (GGDEF)-like protein
MVARIGGDEFGIILPYSNEIVAENAVERIQNMSGMARVGDAELMLSVSIGYATAHTGESLRKVLRQADKAMYQVKESKHNRRMQPGMAGEDTPES